VLVLFGVGGESPVKISKPELRGKLAGLSPEFPESPLLLPHHKYSLPYKPTQKKKNLLKKSRFFSKLTFKNQK